MRRKLSAFLRLPPGDRWLLCLAWWLLLGVAFGLRWLPIRRLLRTVEGAALVSHRQSDRLRWLVAVAARHHFVRARCLEQALVCQRLLARRGVAAELRIGVRRAGAGLAAHAWLEAGGRPIGEPRPTAFLPLAAAGGQR